MPTRADRARPVGAGKGGAPTPGGQALGAGRERPSATAVRVGNLDGHGPEGDGPGAGHEHDSAVGVGQGAGVGRDHVTGQRDPRRPEAVVEAGGHGRGDIPGAEQPGQAGRHRLHVSDVMAGGGGGHHRRGDGGGQRLDDSLHRQRAGHGRQPGAHGHGPRPPVGADHRSAAPAPAAVDGHQAPHGPHHLPV
jgi:hypothetical protein